MAKCKCGTEIDSRTASRNAGLCDSCLDKALRAIARDLAKKKK